MTIIFSAREIVEAAVEKEKIRRDFYQKVAELATDEKMKALFLFLKEEEDRHVSEFTKILDNTPKDSSRPEEYMDEMEAYMDSVIDDQLYSKINSDEFVGNAISEGKV
jgi:rubrerythrin